MSRPVVCDVESIVRSLQVRLGEGFEAASITAAVKAELVTFSAMPVTQYIPILVERRVWTRLNGGRSMHCTPAREAGASEWYGRSA